MQYSYICENIKCFVSKVEVNYSDNKNIICPGCGGNLEKVNTK